jgi:selenocysteine lyase/cysteine desulfurase
LGERVPTVSFTWEGRHPREIAAALGEQGILVWDGKTYALAVTERLGLEGKGGMVRIGAVHAGEAPVTRWKKSNDWAWSCGRSLADRS